jgi:hypothetical protein
MPRRRLLLVTAILTSAASPAAEPVPRVIDDTPEYCRSLAGRLATQPAARLEPSRSLGEQGVKLCAEGHVRTGVTKLRRAMRAATGPRAAESAAGAPAEPRGVTR